MKRYLTAGVALASGIGLAVPLASLGQSPTTTVVTTCPAGLGPPYCGEKTITNPAPPAPDTTQTGPSTDTTSPGAVTAGVPRATPAQVAAIKTAADGVAGQPTAFVGQFNGFLAYRMTGSRRGNLDLSRGGRLKLFVIFDVVPGAFSAKHTVTTTGTTARSAARLRLTSTTRSLNVGELTLVRATVPKATAARIRRSKKASLVTRLSMTGTGAAATTQTTRLIYKRR